MAGYEFDKKLGQRLARLRPADKSQQDVAGELGIKRESVNHWENGLKHIKAEDLAKLARYYRVSADYLLGLSEVAAPDVTTRAAVRRYGLGEGALSVLEGLDRTETGALERLLLSPRLPELLSALAACRDCLVSIRNEEVLSRLEQSDRTGEEWREVMGRVTFRTASDRHLLAYLIVHHEVLMDRLRLSGKAAADAAVASLRRAAEELGNDLVEEGRRQAEAMDEASVPRAMYEAVSRLENAGTVRRGRGEP